MKLMLSLIALRRQSKGEIREQRLSIGKTWGRRR